MAKLLHRIFAARWCGKAVGKLRVFSFEANEKQIETLLDLPVLFPELRYVKLASYWFKTKRLSAMDIKILEEMDALLQLISTQMGYLLSI